jgi:uncharacterized protein
VENRPATGLQIGFLVFAVLLLAVPFDRHVLGQWQWARDADLPTGRIANFLLGGLILLGIPALRRESRQILSRGIPASRVAELALALAMNFVVSLGAFGAFALWSWSVAGEPGLARQMGEHSSHATEWANAISIAGLVFLLIAGTVGPLVEELVFRGFLYRAWKRQWGWPASTVATSVAFGLAHGAFLPQLFASIVFICVMRRTGSLWSSIAVHATFNMLVWYPLLGQFLLPEGRSTGELHLWWLQLGCLAITVVALPLYMWMARDAKVPRTG